MCVIPTSYLLQLKQKTLTNNDLDDDEKEEEAKHTKSHIKNNNFINANKSISEIRN